MQRNKRYLIITIWVSTIAFIAAGMVGWGAYSYSSSDDVATVGKVHVKFDELNAEYSRLIERYSQELGESLDKQRARELGVEEQALKNIVDKALLMNFAIENDLRVSDEEVLRELQSIPAFHKDGKFNAEIYKETLSLNRMKPLNFEEGVKRDLLVKKIVSLLQIKLTPLEKEVLSLPLSLEDELEIGFIYPEEIKVQISQEEIKDFYEQHQDDFREMANYEVGLIRFSKRDLDEEVIINYLKDNPEAAIKSTQDAKQDAKVEEEQIERQDSDKQISESLRSELALKEAQKEAFRAYQLITKDESKLSEFTQETITLLENDELLESIKEDGFSKPLLFEQSYVLAKVLKKNESKVKELKKVELAITNQLKVSKIKEGLNNQAKIRSTLFRGTNVGFIGISDAQKLANKIALNLNINEAKLLLEEIFLSPKKMGYLVLSNKAVLYKVLSQRKTEQGSALNAQLEQIKNSYVLESILEHLRKIYKVSTKLPKE